MRTLRAQLLEKLSFLGFGAAGDREYPTRECDIDQVHGYAVLIRL
jgi:hypothetical protein